MRGVASNTLKSPFVIKLFMSKCNFYYWPHYQAFQSFEFLKHFDSLKEACIYYVINFCSIPPPLHNQDNHCPDPSGVGYDYGAA